ncbi:unnamed protein product [Protopolystoma xenopodis]|uniref:Uncharacterized protein n=1 Tax=Protopolystoma xenopodis TaxID=117903 RepID=A0A448XI86_9PLAT|nr:unnamed protein product [Protopolystoma xenopodis]
MLYSWQYWVDQFGTILLSVVSSLASLSVPDDDTRDHNNQVFPEIRNTEISTPACDESVNHNSNLASGSVFGVHCLRNGSADMPAPQQPEFGACIFDADRSSQQTCSMQGGNRSRTFVCPLSDETLLNSYESESPDELTLVKTACRHGCKLLQRGANFAILWLPHC